MPNTRSPLSSLANMLRILFWTLLIIILLWEWLGRSSIQRKRAAVLEEIQRARGSRVITLIHRQETISLLGIPVSRYIDIDDADAILRAIRLTPPNKPIDLIVHTPGGLALAASQIAYALQDHQGKVTVFVPYYAMSGGTLIALAADEIIMDPNAVLGPVDPQIGEYPAASIIKAVESKTPEHVDDETLILADISRKALKQVTSLVAELLERQLPKEKAEKLTELIATGQFTHDFPITVEHAKSLDLPVSTDMPESIYRLMDLYPQQGIRKPSVNYVPLQPSSS